MKENNKYKNTMNIFINQDNKISSIFVLIKFAMIYNIKIDIIIVISIGDDYNASTK